MSTTVAGWENRPVDCLFIRITHWDDYLQARALHHPANAPTIIFLSGRHEKCTGHLPEVLDFHLQPPYRASRLGAIFTRRAARDFHPRSLDFFFLKAQCRFEVIGFSTLVRVRGRGGSLTIQTDDREYTISGTLTAFQNRLPGRFHQVRRGILVTRNG